MPYTLAYYLTEYSGFDIDNCSFDIVKLLVGSREVPTKSVEVPLVGHTIDTVRNIRSVVSEIEVE